MLRVVQRFVLICFFVVVNKENVFLFSSETEKKGVVFGVSKIRKGRKEKRVLPWKICVDQEESKTNPQKKRVAFARGCIRWIRVNDPSAGSPTETLLRLLLPLNRQVCLSSHSTTFT